MDYKKIGFKAGLELHVQIDGKKLFCNCPCIIKDSKPDFQIKRKLRASESELGTIDKAALHELKKQKYFIYQGYNDVNCLIELDEEPPKEVNQEALKIAIQVSLLLNAKIVDSIQFMRKVIIDGSAVSSFQRTGLLAINGYLETSKGKVSIWKVLLEEEAAKKIEDTKEYRKYNISRLGIPLIEVVTGPEIKDAEHAKEVAEKIGMIIKSVPGIRRGLGTIRQDVSVSVKNGKRIEIKGFQDLRSIQKVVEKEVNRQLELIKKKKKIQNEVRKAEPDFTTSFLRPLPGSARMYPETDVPLFKITKKLLSEIKIPELISEKILKLEKTHKIKTSLASEIVKKQINIDNYLKKYPSLSIKQIADIIIETPKEIKSRLKLDVTKLKEKHFTEVLTLLNKNKINQEAIIQIFEEIIKKGKYDRNKYKPLDEKETEKKIKLIISKNKGAPFGALMGIVMKEFRGKVDGKKISELIKKLL